MSFKHLSREVRRKAIAFTLALAVVCLGSVMLSGCQTLFGPQREIAALCAQITDRNAGVTCVKAGYAAVRDFAGVVEQRRSAGLVTDNEATDFAVKLDEVYAALQIAEAAVFIADLGTAQGRIDTALELLLAFERSLQ